jgi:hypothetical protein
MDGFLAIEHNVEALRRVLAALLAMAGFGGQFAFFPQTGALPQNLALAEKSKLSPAATLPRHLHRAILRILRPAEAAARRLIIALARDILVPVPLPRSSATAPQGRIARGRPQGAGFLPVRRGGVAAGVAGCAPGQRPPPQKISFPILDPLPKNPFGERRVSGPLPRICVPGVTDRRPVPLRLPCRPGDPVDAARLGLRLAALGRALADLPGHARRFARWRMRRRRGTVQRIWPLRMGRPPGTCRRSHDEVQDILAHSNELALYALERRDTS